MHTPLYVVNGNLFFFLDDRFCGETRRAAHRIGLRSKLSDCVKLGITYSHLTIELADNGFIPGTEFLLGGHRALLIPRDLLPLLRRKRLIQTDTGAAAPALPTDPAPDQATRPRRSSQTVGRIPAVEIDLERVEAFDGDHAVIKIKRFSAGDRIWARANEILKGWARSAPAEGADTRVEFSIRYADGFTFVSFYLLRRKHAEDEAQAPDIAGEVRRSAELFAARRRPDHLTEGAYFDLLRMLGRLSRERHSMLLDKYEIPEGDSDPPAPSQPSPPDVDHTTSKFTA